MPGFPNFNFLFKTKWLDSCEKKLKSIYIVFILWYLSLLSDFVIYCGRFLFLTMCDRVYIPSPSLEWDCPITGVIETNFLENVFVIEFLNVEKSLHIVLGEEFLENKSGSTHYVNIVSKSWTFEKIMKL